MLKNAVRVEALYDRDEAERATLTNLLQRRGYEELDGVLAAGRQEGRQEGRAAALRMMLEARGLAVSEAAAERIAACLDLDQLDRWIRRAATVRDTAELFDE